MIGVVFWRIEISIHPPFRAEREQPPPVCHRPQRTEKTFDDTSAMKSFGGVHAALISHSNAGGTRLRSLIGMRLRIVYVDSVAIWMKSSRGQYEWRCYPAQQSHNQRKE